jgi:hypothetical protein
MRNRKANSEFQQFTDLEAGSQPSRLQSPGAPFGFSSKPGEDYGPYKKRKGMPPAGENGSAQRAKYNEAWMSKFGPKDSQSKTAAEIEALYFGTHYAAEEEEEDHADDKHDNAKEASLGNNRYASMIRELFEGRK